MEEKKKKGRKERKKISFLGRIRIIRKTSGRMCERESAKVVVGGKNDQATLRTTELGES